MSLGCSLEGNYVILVPSLIPLFPGNEVSGFLLK
jgi:hypothetical protein